MRGHNGYVAVTDTFINDGIGYGVLIEDHEYLNIQKDSLVFWQPSAEVIKYSIDGVSYTLVRERDIAASYMVEDS